MELVKQKYNAVLKNTQTRTVPTGSSSPADELKVELDNIREIITKPKQVVDLSDSQQEADTEAYIKKIEEEVTEYVF
jgi:DNA-binding ferritin-like protein